jgi:hypothetical protein
VSALQVYGARIGKFSGKLVMADYRNVDYQKILYMIADKCPVKSEKNPGCVSALQVYGARIGKFSSKLIIADHQNVDYHKTSYMIAGKCQVKCEKNPGIVFVFTSLGCQSRQILLQTCNGRPPECRFS